MESGVIGSFLFHNHQFVQGKFAKIYKLVELKDFFHKRKLTSITNSFSFEQNTFHSFACEYVENKLFL